VPFPSIVGEGRYEYLKSTLSPNGEYTADICVFKGGATARNFSFVSVRPVTETKDPDNFDRRVILVQGNVQFSIVWSSNQDLAISYEKGDESQMKNSVDGIRINFSETGI